MDKVRLTIAINICENRIKTIDELIDTNINENYKIVSDADWEILSCDELDQNDYMKKKHEA